MWTVARREFIERVRSRWFVVATVLVPVLMVLLFAVPFLSVRGGTSEREIVVVDATERGLGPGLQDRLGTVNSLSVEVVLASHDQLAGLVDSLDILVSAHLLHAYLIANDELFERGVLQYRSTTPPDAAARLIAEFVRAALVAAELSRVSDDAELVLLARRALSLEAVELDDWQRSEGAGAEVLVLVYAVFFALYFAILIHGISVMGAVVEEKTSRVVEILLSSIGPSDLLAGKIIGVGSVGLLQLGIWAAAAKLLFAGPGWLAPTAATVGGGLSLAGLSLGTELLFVVYFLLGYFLYAGLFATVAAISNSESDARQAQLPVVVILMVPALLLPAVVSDPHSSLATWLSIIPFSAPMMMPVRMVVGSVETSQVTVSILVTGAAVILAAWLAGRIYRVSVLAQGRRLRMRELINCIRTT